MDKNRFRDKTDDELVHDGQRGMSGTGDSIEMTRRLRLTVEQQTEVMKTLNKTGAKLTWVGLALAFMGLVVGIMRLYMYMT